MSKNKSDDCTTSVSKADENKTLFEALPFPIFGINQKSIIVRSNEEAKKIINPERTESDFCYSVIYNRKDICPFCPVLTEWKRENPPDRLEKIVQTIQNDEEQTWKLIFKKINLKNIDFLEIVDDITHQREKQEETLRIEKLAAIGTMISGIAHELNNPLTGIELNVQNLLANLQTTDLNHIVNRLNIIRKDVNRAGRIVNDILNFTKIEKPRLARADITQVIHRAKSNIARLYPVLSKKIEWEIQTLKEGSFKIDADKIERLFINIFRNSVQAFDYRPGRIEISLKKTKKSILIGIKDNAGGIDKENLNKIFNPFYSKSKHGYGSGLGLSICHSIVKEHGGNIRVRSANGKTGFFISLPIISNDTTI